MKCEIAKQKLQAAEDIGGISLIHNEISAHLLGCEHCHHFASELALQRQLAQLDTPLPTQDFIERAIGQAVASYNHTDGAKRIDLRRKSRPVWSLSHPLQAAAAVLLVVGAGLLFVPGEPGLNDDRVRITLVPHQRKEVRVLIESAVARNNATLTVALAENLQMDGYAEQRALTWQTNLKQGANVLSLPLILASESDSHFELKYAYDGYEEKIQVVVNTAGTTANKESLI